MSFWDLQSNASMSIRYVRLNYWCWKHATLCMEEHNKTRTLSRNNPKNILVKLILEATRKSQQISKKVVQYFNHYLMTQ